MCEPGFACVAVVGGSWRAPKIKMNSPPQDPRTAPPEADVSWPDGAGLVLRRPGVCGRPGVLLRPDPTPPPPRPARQAPRSQDPERRFGIRAAGRQNPFVGLPPAVSRAVDSAFGLASRDSSSGGACAT